MTSQPITITLDLAWIGEGPECVEWQPSKVAEATDANMIDMLDEVDAARFGQAWREMQGLPPLPMEGWIVRDELDKRNAVDWRQLYEAVPEVDPLPDEVRAIAAAREEGGFVEHPRATCQHVWSDDQLQWTVKTTPQKHNQTCSLCGEKRFA